VSATIEFYAADAKKLVEAFEIEDFEEWYEAKSVFTKADLGINFLLPDDLDSLLTAMREHGLNLPDRFAELIVDEVWNDGQNTARIQLLDERLKAVGAIDDEVFGRITNSWTSDFDEPGPARLALEELRRVCQQSLEKGNPVLLYVCQ